MDETNSSAAVATLPDPSPTPETTEAPAETNGQAAETNGAASESATAQAQDEQAAAAATDEQSPPPSATDEEVAALRRQVSELTNRLDRLNAHERRVILAEQHVAELEGEVNECKEALKAAKDRFDKAVDRLRSEIKNRDGQGELPFKEADALQQNVQQNGENCQQAEKDPEPTAPLKIHDQFGETPLTQIGVTPSQCEKLAQLEPRVETVADLEKLIAGGGFVPKSIKGLGEKAINTISDKLLKFRGEHPNPNEKVPEQVNGEHDAAQFHAGQIARADGKDQSANPNEAETKLWQDWNAGWAKKNAELATPEPECETGWLTISIPLDLFPTCSATLKLLQDTKAPEPFRWGCLAEATNGNGLSLKETEEDEGGIELFPTREEAIEDACDRLAEWFTKRVPEIGEGVANAIDEWADKTLAGIVTHDETATESAAE